MINGNGLSYHKDLRIQYKIIFIFVDSIEKCRVIITKYYWEEQQSQSFGFTFYNRFRVTHIKQKYMKK